MCVFGCHCFGLLEYGRGHAHDAVRALPDLGWCNHILVYSGSSWAWYCHRCRAGFNKEKGLILSTVLAVKKDGAIALGSDLQETIGDRRADVEPTPKWLVFDKCAFGGVGTKRFLNLLTHLKDRLFSKPCHPYELCWELKKFLEADGWKPDTENRYTGDYGISGLYVFEGDIYRINGYFEYGNVGGFDAIGTGSHFALGVMRGFYNRLPHAKDIAQEGLMSACHYDVYSSGIWVQELD